MSEKLKTGNTEEMLENISEDTEKESGTEISETTENTSDAQTQKYVVENQEYVYSTYSDIGQLGKRETIIIQIIRGRMHMKCLYLRQRQISHTMGLQTSFP